MTLEKTVMLLTVGLLGILAGSGPQQTTEWMSLEPGIELRWLVARNPSKVGDSRIALVRIDPAKWDLRLVGRSQTGDSAGMTARDWAKRHGLVATINAGMFGTDQTTHVGY